MKAIVPTLEVLEEGRTYRWCACGKTATPPWCDNSQGTGCAPVTFERAGVDKAMICACKQTKNPPYCDGSHRALMAPDARDREERFPTGEPVRDQHSRPVRIGAACPDLPVADCPAAIRYYCDVLGFTKVFDDALLGFDRTLYACVARGDLKLTLDWHRSDEVAHKVHLMAEVDDVDALHAELSGRGAKIVGELTDRPWGERDFTVEDLDGHKIGFTMTVT